MKILFPSLLGLFIASLFFHKYIEKILNKNQLGLLKKITIVLMIVSFIFTLLVTFMDFTTEKKEFGWAVDYVQYSKLHDYSTGKSQKIALIDSGISKFQSEIDNRNSISFVGDTNDNNGHGTMMYSIIKGYSNKIYGIAPDAEILSIKVMDNEEKLKPSVVADALNLAIDKKCTVINLSIGSYNLNQNVSDAIKRALNEGITVVASSGDYQNDDMMFPASEAGVISVGSLSANNRVSDFTNAPSDCVIIAPGDEIKTVNNKGVIASTSGTSQATAIIAGYVALLRDYSLQKNIKLGNKEISDILKSINDKKSTYIDPFLTRK